MQSLVSCFNGFAVKFQKDFASVAVTDGQLLVVKCSQEEYGSIFNNIINSYIPEHNYQLAGAVHEYYSPQESDGGLYLYFPIERL